VVRVSATYELSGLPAGTFTDRFRFQLGQSGLGSGSITTNFSGDPGNPTDLDFVSGNFFNGTASFPISIAHIGHQELGAATAYRSRSARLLF
jgi:hypothetical protein